MRPVFCGNFEYDTRQSELERLFSRYGRVERVDMKSGFAFVYMDDERDAEDAIRALDDIEFGRQRRRLSVEWARNLTLFHHKIPCLGDRGVRRDGLRGANMRPTKTLFVINFDPLITRVRDLERHFEPYGNLVHVRIRRNFAFIQYETQEEATKALDATHMSKLLDRVISVEYAIRDDDERDAHRESPVRRGYGRRGSPVYAGRSPSPGYGRHGRRSSPDYKRGSSPVYSRHSKRETPNYGRGRSPSYDRYRAPANDKHRSPAYERNQSPAYDRNNSPAYDRYRSRSPPRRSRT